MLHNIVFIYVTYKVRYYTLRDVYNVACTICEVYKTLGALYKLYKKHCIHIEMYENSLHNYE